MRIIEVVIDGFKSYAVRTVISGWDDSFNAITGLNGSGKSNILDAICFVLGLTNIATVRAQNLQDLIYKRGQAGVTRASVTIVFDNSDKAKSPINFKNFETISVTRQIVLGGTHKYLINGHRAQPTSVQSLFQSIQLNINNPNFLIMQGRITKVLNMKKEEILAMLEEAAGTRMFEDRRDKAHKTMAKKEMKVQEIQGLLRDEIDPKLERLRQEKRAFMEFQQTQNNLETLTRLVVAYKHCRYQERLRSSEKDLAEKKQLKEHYRDNADKLGQEINLLREDLDKINAVREEEMRKGGRFAALDEAVKNHSHELVRLTTVLDLKKSSMEEDENSRKDSQVAVQQLEKQLAESTKQHQTLSKQFEAVNSDLQKQSQSLDKKEELLQTLQTGVASREGQEGGYQGQLQDARNRASAAATEQEQANLKIAHFVSRIKEDEPRARKAEKENATLSRDLDVLKAQAEKLHANLQRLGIDPDREQAARQEQRRLETEIAQINEKADVMRRSVANLNFSYSDPTPNFDRSKVKGLVAQLFTVNKQHMQAGTALEICAGGRLYNVIVDQYETASQLMTNGKLRNRVTIIPLNQINAFRASAQQIGAAQRLAPNKVHLALDLVGYKEEIEAAMAFVFGSTLICKDDDAAKSVTFDASVRLKSVTLDGSVYNPSGTLSGGSAPTTSGMLVKLQQLHELTQEGEALQQALDKLNLAMDKEKQRLEGSKKLRHELDLKMHEIGLAEEQIKSNSSSSIIQAVLEMKEGIEKLKTVIAEAKTKQSEANNDAKRIEKDMNDFANNKDSKLVELQTEIEVLKKSLAKQSASIKPLQQAVREAMLEAEQCESDLAAARERLAEAEQSLQTQRDELEELLKQQQQIKQASDSAQAELEDERARLSGFDNEVAALQKTMSSKTSQVKKESLEAKELEHQIDNFSKEQQTAAQQLSRLEEENDWVRDEIDSFGKPGTPYDFRGRNMAECDANLKRIKERFEGMKKKINPKVMNMIDSVEKKEASLKTMMRTVIKDKAKIEETIVTLDGYKRDKLQEVWQQVNTDFGNIFNELLPGNTARLDPPENKTISAGLEIKVCLGKVWKQSLTELSGGQRSLIALALIMALLQYSPAPMYILDEVDAALDLDHTQRIGELVKTRFKGAQFIIVSLKDGLFSNANSLFTTRFVDGTSVVKLTRTVDGVK